MADDKIVTRLLEGLISIVDRLKAEVGENQQHYVAGHGSSDIVFVRENGMDIKYQDYKINVEVAKK